MLGVWTVQSIRELDTYGPDFTSLKPRVMITLVIVGLLFAAGQRRVAVSADPVGVAGQPGDLLRLK